jgi:hypothetical protein
MAKPKPGAVCEVLLSDFLTPLVLGGEMRPGKPLGAALALALMQQADHLTPDAEKVSLLTLARVRIARKLAPIDRIEGISGPEWALAAVLHDIVQSAHPDLGGVFRSSAPQKVLDLAAAALDRIPPPTSVREALERHTLFSRILEITRTDTRVSWWVGSATFLGTDPPKRLQAWPEVRRVHVEKTPRALLDLPAAGGHAPAARFFEVIASFLKKTPITDLASCTRSTPEFRFTQEVLSIAGTRAGRTLLLRVLQRLPEETVDCAIGRALREVLAGGPSPPLSATLMLLAERALLLAQCALGSTERALRASPTPDGALAQVVSARAAMQLIAVDGAGLSGEERAGMLAILRPLASLVLAEPAASLLANAPAA